MQGSKGTLDGFPTKNHTIAVTRWSLDKRKHCKAEGKMMKSCRRTIKMESCTESKCHKCARQHGKSPPQKRHTFGIMHWILDRKFAKQDDQKIGYIVTHESQNLQCSSHTMAKNPTGSKFLAWRYNKKWELGFCWILLQKHSQGSLRRLFALGWGHVEHHQPIQILSACLPRQNFVSLKEGSVFWVL